MRTPLTHRIQYRLFEMFRHGRLRQLPVLPDTGPSATPHPVEAAPSSSISASMPWAEAARLAGLGLVPSDDFRRIDGVCRVVETVGPPDARHYARLIHAWDPAFFSHPDVRTIDRWGNPVRLPGLLLGTPHRFSPTTLRYLATALWLRRNRFVTPGCPIVEVGIGFGGLAAMNAVVSGANSLLVDLPQVEPLALRFLRETGLANHARGSSGTPPADGFCFLSNYAFTELSAPVQDLYLDTYIRHSARGVITSNAGVFSRHAGGRSDEELLELLHRAGLPATLSRTPDILGPSDRLCDCSLITWDTAGMHP